MGKRRYSVTLSEENVKRFQAICKKGGLPLSTMSSALDDFLRDISPIMEKAAEKGKFSTLDFFTYLGEQVQAVVEEEKAEQRKIDLAYQVGKQIGEKEVASCDKIGTKKKNPRISA